MSSKEPQVREVLHLDPALIDDGPERRGYVDAEEYRSLVHSLKELGMREPIRVGHGEEGRYVVRSGQLRLRAARDAGLTLIMCMIDEGPLREGDDRLEWLAVNDQRCTVDPITRAHIWLEARTLQGWKQADLGAHLGTSQNTVARLERLIAKDVPTVLQHKVRCGDISASMAYDILQLEDADERDKAIKDCRLPKAPAEKGSATGKDKPKEVFEREWLLPTRGKTPPACIVFRGPKKKYDDKEIIAKLQWLIDELSGPKLAVIDEDDGPTVLPLAS